MTKKTKATTESQPKENAALRLARTEAQVQALVKAVQTQQHSIQMLADESDKLRELMLGVARRLNTVIQAAEAGNLTMESVNAIIRDQNAQTLKSTVDTLVENGVLVLKETEVLENDFVVGREVDLATGSVLNPRLQFAMAQMPENVKAAVLGKKAGDKASSAEDKSAIEILEVYSVIEEKDLELEKQA